MSKLDDILAQYLDLPVEVFKTAEDKEDVKFKQAFKDLMFDMVNSITAYSDALEYRGKYLQMFEIEELKNKIKEL